MSKLEGKTSGMFLRFLNENAPTLAIGGAIGTLVGALWAAFKASENVSKAKAKYDEKVKKIASEAISEDEKAAKMKDAKSECNTRYVLAYKWAALLGAGSIALMITANALNGAKIAGITAIAMANQDKLKKLAENGKKMIGDAPWKEVEDKTLEDIVAENFFGKDGPKAKKLNPKNGKVFVETTSGTIIQSEEYDINDALQRAEEYFEHRGELSQAKYFEMLGYAETPAGSKELFWGRNNPFKAHVGKRTFPNLGLTCFSIELDNPPMVAENAFGKESTRTYLSEEGKDHWGAKLKAMSEENKQKEAVSA